MIFQCVDVCYERAGSYSMAAASNRLTHKPIEFPDSSSLYLVVGRQHWSLSTVESFKYRPHFLVMNFLG